MFTAVTVFMIYYIIELYYGPCSCPLFFTWLRHNGSQGCQAHSHLSLCSFTHNIWGHSLYALFLIRSGQMIKIRAAVWKRMWECRLHIHGAHQLRFRSTLLFCCPSPCSWLDVSVGSGAIGAILDSQRTCKWKLHTNKTGVETARAWAHKNAVSTMPTLAWSV